MINIFWNLGYFVILLFSFLISFTNWRWLNDIEK